jgi:hypothetical protein
VLNPRNLAWLILGGFALLEIFQTRFDDFIVYWRAGLQALEGTSLYSVPGHYQYKYSPFIALLFGILHQVLHGFWCFLGFEAGGYAEHGSGDGPLVWGSVRLVACSLGVIFFLAWRSWFFDLHHRLNPDPASHRGFFVVTLLMSVPLLKELHFGQVNAIPALLLTHSILQLDRNHAPFSRRSTCQAIGAGAALSLAVQVKLYALAIVPILIFRKKSSWLFAFLMFSVLTLLVIPACFHGWTHAVSEGVAWARSLTASSQDLITSHFNISWLGFSRRVTDSGIVSLASWLFLGAVFLFSSHRIRRSESRYPLMLVFCSILVLNPLVWNYWMILLTPALFHLCAKFLSDPAGRSSRLLLLAALASPAFFLLESRIVQNYLDPLLVLLVWILVVKLSPSSERPVSG